MKHKTHKGLAKRVKVTARGKVKRARKSFTGHLMSGRSSKQRRRLRRGGLLTPTEARRAREALGC